jgi:SAM-dependent methyltransferase
MGSNVISSRVAILKEVMEINSSENFHDFFFRISINNLFKSNPMQKFESVLAIGANHVEARNLIKFPFKKIVLSGISEPDVKTMEIIKKDKRVSYVKQNMEKLTFSNRSFDLVFVKEAIHHIPRPILALYEMLRVAKKGVIFIEPQESCLGNILDKLNLSSKYEKNQMGNTKFRDNFVYRWRRKEIIKLLNSYYLESGYKVNFTSCWMSNRFNMKSKFLIPLFNLFGWLMSFVPGNKGNYLICTIIPGKSFPE